MKTKLLLLLLAIFSFVIMFGQGNNQMKNPLKQNPNSGAVQLEVGGDFIFQSFVLIGLESNTQRIVLQKELNQNPNFKKIKITSENEFQAFVNKDFIKQLTVFFENKDLQIDYSPKTTDGKPLYENTGNRELDIKQYEARKKRWIEENPKKYKKITNSTIN